MAKIIKLTETEIEQARQAFEESLSKLRLTDGQINFSKSFTAIERKATIYMTGIAWMKMQTLVREFDKEVAWHGVAFRGEDETKDEYTITDILVYPQEVTSTTVDMDVEAYQDWLNALTDDVFNNLRMQGHSHVNMSVGPSGTDENLYKQMLANLPEDSFYIFMIWNKKWDKTVKLYDMKKNLFFGTTDCEVKVIDDLGMEEFLKNAKENVKTKTYTTVSYTKGASSTYTSQAKDAKTVTNAVAPANQETKKGKRKEKTKTTYQNAASGQWWNGRWYGDDDDPYGPFGYLENLPY